MIRRPPRSTQSRSSAASDVYKRQEHARTMDASDLWTAGKHLIAVIDPDGDEREQEKQLAREERAAHLNRFLSITEDGAGGEREQGGLDHRGVLDGGSALDPD